MYNRKSLFCTFMKCHQHLHPLSKVESSFANRGNDQYCNINHIYINSLHLSICLSVYLMGVLGGWGRERPVKQRATGVSL
jgi:hypothetical protein